MGEISRTRVYEGTWRGTGAEIPHKGPLQLTLCGAAIALWAYVSAFAVAVWFQNKTSFGFLSPNYMRHIVQSFVKSKYKLARTVFVFLALLAKKPMGF